MPAPSLSRAAPCAAALVLALVLGCAGPGLPPPAGWCPTLPGEPEDGGTPLTFALVEPVDPARLRTPANDSEAIVFRHFYEGLTDLDCRGEVVPALAESWKTPDGGTTWIFLLREDARFTDGSPVTGGDIRQSWRAGRRLAVHDPARFALWQRVRLKQMEFRRYQLTIRLERPDPSLPALLAGPSFVIAKDGLQRWPLGTRGIVVRERMEPDRLVITGERTASSDGARPEIRFAVTPGRDPRDAFVKGIDLLLTRDRVALEQLARRGGARLTPLPWTRLYVFADPAMAPPAEGPLHALRVELAEDVLPSVARPAESVLLEPVDADEGADRAAPPRGDAQGSSPASGGPILFAAGDGDAARIAERIASLRSREGVFVAVEEVSAAALATRAASGHGGGFVIPVLRGLPNASHQRDRLGAFRPPDRAAGFVPLVRTRAMLVSREDVAGVQVGYDGVPRLGGAGRTREDTP